MKAWRWVARGRDLALKVWTWAAWAGGMGLKVVTGLGRCADRVTDMAVAVMTRLCTWTAWVLGIGLVVMTGLLMLGFMGTCMYTAQMAAEGPPQPIPAVLPPDQPTYTVYRIIDGDTLEIIDAGGIRTRVRLQDVDAPEPDEPGGPEATAALEAQLPIGSGVDVYPKARDKYGRLIADVLPAGVDPAVAEAQAYLTKVELRNVRIAEGSLSRRGVFGEVKNRGNRTLAEVKILVFCLDASGKPVHEETFYPVNSSSWTSPDPLRPNYARKFGYSMEDAPSDWSGKVRAAVTAVEFAEGS